MEFQTLPLADGTLDAVAAMGFYNTTPIQAAAIPPMLEGRDVVGQARTGTGKTAAFGLPIVDAYRAERGDHVYALVLVPTRELANQVCEAMEDMARGSRLSMIPIYGGAGFGPQLNALRRRGPKVVVATPGRLLDLLQRGDIGLDKVGVWVLDEADRMLDMGFVHDMRRVAKEVPKRRQTALFSATISHDIKRLIDEFTTDPVHISVDDGEVTTPLTEQHAWWVDKAHKTDALLHLLGDMEPERGVVFTRTKHLAKRLAKRLSNEGWSSVALQGNMTQAQRDRAMASFRAGKQRLLVATDVAARGLDVPGIDVVVNFDVPDDPEQYVHRIGRTGRNGEEGVAYTFVQRDQKRDLRDLEREAGRRIDPITPGTFEPKDGPDPRPTHNESQPGNSGGGRGHGGQGGRRGGRSQGRSNHSGHGQSKRRSGPSSQSRGRGNGGGQRRNGGSRGGGQGGASGSGRRPGRGGPSGGRGSGGGQRQRAGPQSRRN